MSKSIKKVAGVALPIAASFIPGIGIPLAAALGGAGGLMGGGGLKGALLGAAGGALGAGGFGNTLGAAAGITSQAGRSALTGGLLGAGSGALMGGGLKGALAGGALGAGGGYLAGGGLSQLGGGTLTGGGAFPSGAAAPSLTGGLTDITAGGLGGLSTGATNITSPFISGAGSSLPALSYGAGSSIPSGAFAQTGGNIFSRLLEKAQAGGIQAPGMQTPGLGTIGSNLYSGIQGTQAYKDMAAAQQAANQQALSAVSPFMQSGQAANQRLSSLLGLGGEDSEETLNALRSSPGYQFRQEQGQQALDRSLAARGGLMSGRALKATQELGQGLADQTYNDYIRNLAQQSSQGLGAAGMGAGMYGVGGDIEANRLLGQSNLQNRSLANIMGGY